MANKKIYIIIILLVLLSGSFYFFKKDKSDNAISSNSDEIVEEDNNEPTERWVSLEISPNATFGALMAQAGIATATANAIHESSLDVYDLAKIKAGYFLDLKFSPDSDKLLGLKYKIDSEDELIINLDSESGQCLAEVNPIDYEVKIAVKEGEVESSMYEAALKNNIDERAIIALADAFQWSIDFAMDPRVGDKFRFVYEERYLDGQYQMPGRILAGQYINDGQKYQVYYFEEDKDNQGYFDENANSVQKMFLKAPLAFKYISSGFTTGLRYVEAFNVSTGHRAIDYAAPQGTPVRAVGDGTVVMASWNGSYGNMVKIRHNGTYQTNYGHLSRFAVRNGAKVKQGDVIGYVGSTGFSTGPHLHYEMVKNGVKINPLAEVMPPGQAIKSENKERFFSEISDWKKTLEE